MIQQIQSPCDECNGTGETISAKDRCTQCKGKKVVPDKKFLEVHIDKGMKGGQTIQFRGESDQSPTAEAGDVIIVIEEKPHERFRRQENDLICEVEVDLLTALAGGEFAIRHLDERALLVKVHPGEIVRHGMLIFHFSKILANLSLGDLKLIRGQGMPSQRHHEPGDLYVKLSVKFPETIEPSALPLLEKALPSRKPVDKFEKGVVIDEVDMEDTDARQGPGGMRDDPMDEDTDEPRVQCANQ